MKGKLIFAASLLGAGVAFGGTTVLETDEYIVGVKPVSLRSGQTEVLLSIPWVEAGSTATDETIAATNMVKTAGLVNGDMLYWYMTSDGKWNAWEVYDGAWRATTIDNGDGTFSKPLPNAKMMSRGEAVLLKLTTERGGEVLPSTVYVVGQKGDDISSQIDISATGVTLIAPPSASGDTDLNTGATWTGVSSGDMIYIDNGNGGAFKIFVRGQLNSEPAWVEEKADGDVVSAEIPAGYGAFYRPDGEGSTRTVTWKNL